MIKELLASLNYAPVEKHDFHDPLGWIEPDGLICSQHNETWLYKTLPLVSAGEHEHEQLTDLFKAAAATTRPVGISRHANRRQFHICFIHNGIQHTLSEPDLEQPDKLALIGFKIANDSSSSSRIKTSWQLADRKPSADCQQVTESISHDLEFVERIMFDHRCLTPSKPEMKALLGWHKPSSPILGDSQIRISADMVKAILSNVEGAERIWELRALSDWNSAIIDGAYLSQAADHSAGNWVCSIRGELENGWVAKNNARAKLKTLESRLNAGQNLKKRHALTEIEADSLRLEAWQLSEQIDHLAITGEPTIVNFSMVIAQELFRDSQDPNVLAEPLGIAPADWLRENHGFQLFKCPNKQWQLLESMLACGNTKPIRKPPFAHQVSLSAITQSGINATQNRLCGTPLMLSP